MSIARTKIKGLVLLNSRTTVPGFTLFTPVNDKAVYLIDNRGEVVREWKLAEKPASGGRLLPNGNLLVLLQDPESPCFGIEGSGGYLQEVDADSNVVWEYKDRYLHHEAIMLTNGNILAMRWEPMDESLAARVKGGFPVDGPMLDEGMIEINYRKQIVWDWKASDRISPEEIYHCPVCQRDSWLHLNSVYEMKNGHLLISFAKANTVAVVSKTDKNIIWQWDSKGEVSHQHSPIELQNGNIMIFDNGMHPFKFSTDFSRVIELNPGSNKVVWMYMGDSDNRLAVYFDSPIYSNVQQLVNKNLIITDGLSGTIFEIAPNGELLWEYVNPYPLEDGIEEPHSKPIYSAYKYDKEFPGIKAIFNANYM
ncbi:MAG: arylsulfotransferase family protein [Anaerolineaceae bacterium]|jgi:hypothetical protein